MAEGGYDFDNSEFYRDDSDDDGDIDDKLRMVSDDDTQWVAVINQRSHIAHLRGQLRESSLEGQKQRLVKTFYAEIGSRYKMFPGKMEKDQFKITDDGKTLYWVVGAKVIRITAKQGPESFLSLGSIASEYNKSVGSEGTCAIRQFLNLSDYNSETRPSQRAKNVLESTQNDLITAGQNIPLKD